MPIEVICETCGKVFSKTPYKFKKSTRHFCSQRCSSVAQRKLVETKCETCGKLIVRKQSQFNKYKHHFCSKLCLSEWKTKQYAGDGNPSWNGGKVNIICPICDGEFEVIPARQKRSGVICCSTKCMGKWNSENRNGENHPSWNGGDVDATCKMCGTSFRVKQNQKRNGFGKFCSRKCVGKWNTIHRIGENHPGWMGGISFEPYCNKFNAAFKEHIRDKFGRTCFLCGKTEHEAMDAQAKVGKRAYKLSVHHVNYDKNCLCGDIKCAFVPLCQSCHTKTNHYRNYFESFITGKLMECENIK